MGYEPETAKETELLPPDAILDGKIIEIKDGKAEDFVTATDKWRGDIKAPAINVRAEVKHGKITTQFMEVFTYFVDDNGGTIFTPRMKIGKFKLKYGSLPKVGVDVKVITDKDSFCKIKLD